MFPLEKESVSSKDIVDKVLQKLNVATNIFQEYNEQFLKITSSFQPKELDKNEKYGL